MNTYFIIGLPLLGIAFFNALLGFLFLKKNPHHSNLNRAAAVIGFSTALFALFAAIVYIRAGLGLDYDIYYRACWIGWVGTAAFFQLPCFIKDDKSRVGLVGGGILYVFWLIVYVFCFTTNWFETGVHSLIPFVPRYGPLEQFVRIIAGILLVWIIYRLFKVRREVSGIKKTQLNYFILGAIIYGIGGALGAGFCLKLGGFSLDPVLVAYFSLPWLALTFYAITRYRLFDIQIIVSNALSTVILTLILGGLNIIIFKLLQPLLGSSWAILTAIFVVTVVFLLTPLRRTVLGGFYDTLLGDRYGYQAILRESIKAIVTILDQDEMLNYLVHILQQSFKVNKVCLFLKNPEGHYALSYQWGMGRGVPFGLKLSDENMVEWFKKTKQIFIKEEQQAMLSKEEFGRFYGDFDTIEAHLALPLFYKDNLIGFLAMGPRDNDLPYVQSDVDILQTLTSQAAIAIENAHLYKEAITDGLTGLYHHKYFMMRLKEEIERAQRYGRPLSLMLIDIDNFKTINDCCGHLAGDKVLVAIANMIKKNQRSTDVVARYGGDEFAVILPDTDQRAALFPARRLRERVEKSPLEENILVTVSIGLVSLDHKQKNLKPEDFVALVDKGLYQAKNNGKNRIELQDQ